jgi:hypothetical protein
VAVAVPIPRLGPNALKYVPEKPAFVDLTAAHLGDNGTGKDGFDAMTRVVINSLADETAIGKVLDQHLADAYFVPGELAKGNYNPVLAELATFHTDGDKLLTDLDKTINPPPKKKK